MAIIEIAFGHFTLFSHLFLFSLGAFSAWPRQHPIHSIVALHLICPIIYISMHSDTVVFWRCSHCYLAVVHTHRALPLPILWANFDANLCLCWLMQCHRCSFTSIYFICHASAIAVCRARFALSLINYVNFVLTLRTIRVTTWSAWLIDLSAEELLQTANRRHAFTLSNFT